MLKFSVQNKRKRATKEQTTPPAVGDSDGRTCLSVPATGFTDTKNTDLVIKTGEKESCEDVADGSKSSTTPKELFQRRSTPKENAWCAESGNSNLENKLTGSPSNIQNPNGLSVGDCKRPLPPIPGQRRQDVGVLSSISEEDLTSCNHESPVQDTNKNGYLDRSAKQEQQGYTDIFGIIGPMETSKAADDARNTHPEDGNSSGGNESVFSSRSGNLNYMEKFQNFKEALFLTDPKALWSSSDESSDYVTMESVDPSTKFTTWPRPLFRSFGKLPDGLPPATPLPRAGLDSRWIGSCGSSGRGSERSSCSVHSEESARSSGGFSDGSEASALSKDSGQSTGSSDLRSDQPCRLYEDTIYMLDSPGQDSSSGIASDDHGTPPSGHGDSPPTSCLCDKSRLGQKSQLHSRLIQHPSQSYQHSQQQQQQQQQQQRLYLGQTGYSKQSYCVTKAMKYAQPGHKVRSTALQRSHVTPELRYPDSTSPTCGMVQGYQETDLDEPLSDCTYVFPTHPRKSSSHRHAQILAETPPCYQDTLGELGDGIYAPMNGMVAPHSTQMLFPTKDSHKRFGKGFENTKKYKISYFEILPDDVIVKIFSHLSSDRLSTCGRVCRRWYDLAWDPVLWTSITINSAAVDVDRALRVLSKKLSYETPTVCAIVERINLNSCAKLTDKGLYTIARRCTELRQLEIQGCVNVSNISLFEVVSNCVNLEHLNVAGCTSVTCICLTPEATVQAANYGKQVYLRYLDMSDCFQLDDSGLQLIASYCSQLVHLYLRRCSRISDIGVQYVANYCPNLKEFSISDCHNVTDFGMRELSKLGANLRYLSVAKCDRITDAGVRHLARHCPRLRYLNLRGCELVSDDAVEMFAKCCTRLRSLDVGKCDVTDDALHSLALYCPQLRKLSLKSCDAVTDRGMVMLAQRCTQLQQLNIQDCHLSVEAYRMVKTCCKRCIIEHTNPGFY